MQNPKLKALGEEIERATVVAGDLAQRAQTALDAAGLTGAGDLANVDAVLALIDRALPGWAISLEGSASREHGHWTCSLRRSRERDNDEVVGVGHGQHLAPALLGALFKVFALRPPP